MLAVALKRMNAIIESLAYSHSKRCWLKTRAEKTKRFFVHCFGRKSRISAGIVTYQKYDEITKVCGQERKLT